MTHMQPGGQIPSQRSQHPPWKQRLIDQGRLMEYQVVSMRSTLIGDKMDTSLLQLLLNQHAAQGWTVKSIIDTEVKGRVGPGGTAGLIIVFERPVLA